FVERLHRQLGEAGVGVDRLRIVNRVPTRADVHAVLRLADVYLDSFPFAGACSLLDCLQVGLPVVARGGSTFRGEVAAAMLRAVGLDELIATDDAAYVELGVSLGRDAARRARAAARIRQQHDRLPPYLDMAAADACVTEAYLDMLEARRRADAALAAARP